MSDDPSWGEVEPSPRPKLRVFDSSGNGTALWDQRYDPGARQWFAPPASDFAESLYIASTGMILRLFHSKHPNLMGSAECGDLFDQDSYAVRCEWADAAKWLEKHGYPVPDDVADPRPPQGPGAAESATVPGDDDPEGKESRVAVRNARFVEWYNARGTETYHKPAAIVDKWSGLGRKGQAEIAPEAIGNVSKSTVEAAIKAWKKTKGANSAE